MLEIIHNRWPYQVDFEWNGHDHIEICGQIYPVGHWLFAAYVKSGSRIEALSGAFLPSFDDQDRLDLLQSLQAEATKWCCL